MSKLLQRRDAILDSLRTQFKAKVMYVFILPERRIANAAQLDALLVDLANNAAQATHAEDCTGCGAGPLHASESDDEGRCATCAQHVDEVVAFHLWA